MNYSEIQLRHLFKVYSGSTPESGNGFYWDGNIPWVTPEDLSQLNGSTLFDTRRKITEEGFENSGVKMAPINSIVLSKRAPIGLLAILGLEACCNQGCFLLTPQQNIHTKYYYYYLLSIKQELQILGRGSTFMELSLDDIKSVKVKTPEFNRQKAIADYLDNEIKRIDELVNFKEKQIQLLSEKRDALISQAVTKGLNPKVKKKASGVDWLGEIPAHWELKKIKYISKLKSGEFITSDSISENEKYAVYGGNGVRGYTSDKTHDGEFILIGRQGALCGNINYAKGEFWASEHAVVCHPIKQYEIIWFGELLRIMNLNQYSAAAAQPGLSVEVISNLRIPFPPIHEQKLISDYIIEHLQQIDNILSFSEKSINLLKERKSALITEAVAGQLNIN